MNKKPLLYAVIILAHTAATLHAECPHNKLFNFFRNSEQEKNVDQAPATNTTDKTKTTALEDNIITDLAPPAEKKEQPDIPKLKDEYRRLTTELEEAHDWLMVLTDVECGNDTSFFEQYDNLMNNMDTCKNPAKKEALEHRIERLIAIKEKVINWPNKYSENQAQEAYNMLLAKLNKVKASLEKAKS